MLAIIIPYFKLTFFEATLTSLAAQTCQDFKVYIGNDASPEDPSNLIEKYKGQFDFSYHRFEDNLGGTSLTKQWERCIALSSNEEWLMILGDDDVLSCNCVSSFYSNLENINENNIDVVRFATFKINELNNKISNKVDHPKIEKSIDFLFRKSRSSLSEYIFKINKIQEIGLKDFPLAWHSDVLAVLEFSNFDNVFSVNEAFVEVRISNQSISGKTSNLKLKNKATFQFYEYLILKKIKLFSNSQKTIIFNSLNKLYVNDKKNFFIFIKITIVYLKIKSFKSLLKFYKFILRK